MRKIVGRRSLARARESETKERDDEKEQKNMEGRSKSIPSCSDPRTF